MIYLLILLCILHVIMVINYVILANRVFWLREDVDFLITLKDSHENNPITVTLDFDPSVGGYVFKTEEDNDQ